jgi:hypothetical protein
METLGKELTFEVVDRERRPWRAVAATVQVVISRRKMIEIVRRFRVKVGLATPSWFAHMADEDSGLLTTEAGACWYDVQGKLVPGGLMKDKCPISLRKDGTMNLYDILRGQMVYSKPYLLEDLVREFEESIDLVRLPDDRLQPGQRQGVFRFAARPS